MHRIVEKHFSIIIAPVRSRGGSLVFILKKIFVMRSGHYLILSAGHCTSLMTVEFVNQ
jgi:hypothetical protein